MLEDMVKEVSCVIDTRNQGRVSQWYIREGDAIRKAKQMVSWYGQVGNYAAVTGKVVDFKFCKGFEPNETNGQQFHENQNH